MASHKVRLGQVKWDYLSYMNYVEILCAGLLCMFKYCFVCLDNVCSITCTLKYGMLKKVSVQKLSAEICVCPKICRSWEHYSFSLSNQNQISLFCYLMDQFQNFGLVRPKLEPISVKLKMAWEKVIDWHFIKCKYTLQLFVYNTLQWPHHGA